MKNSKILKIVRTLSKEELRTLEKFICSPIHNSHTDVIALFKYIKKHHHANDSKFENKKIFKYLFPKQSFNMQKVHHINSYLFKVLEEFLAWQEWKSDKIGQKIYLTKAYNKHRLTEHQNKAFQNANKIQEGLNTRNSQYYWQRYQLQFGQLDYYRRLGRTVDFDLQEYSELLDIYFIAEKLKSSCGLISHQTISTKHYDMGLLSHIFNYIENENLLKIPAISTYYYAYKALYNIEETEHFYNLKNELFEHENKFTLSELRDIYLLAINFCIKRLNKGDHDLMTEIFQLYKRGLLVNVFLEKGYISRYSYNNIIIAGLKMKEYDWVETFIHKYAEMLHQDHREGSYNFNLAKYYYETGNYDEAMQLLQKMEYDDLLHNMGAKIMLAKMYYEMEELDTLDNLIKSVRIYIRRKKMLGYHKEVYENIFSFLKKLTTLNPFDKKARELLKNEIQNTKVLTEKDWLLLQLDKME